MCQERERMRQHIKCNKTALAATTSSKHIRCDIALDSVIFPSFRFYQENFCLMMCLLLLFLVRLSVFLLDSSKNTMHGWTLTLSDSVLTASSPASKAETRDISTSPVASHAGKNNNNNDCTAGARGVPVWPLWVSQALEWSSHVALLSGDWTIRTEGQRAAHHRDSGIAQPSLGGPMPWVSGGVAPDQRTAKLLRGGGAGWGGRSWRGRWGSSEAVRTGDMRADHCGNTSE